jgi:GxxExxY protein
VHPELSHAIVGAAIEVHRRIGPGQLESVYQRSLACELRYRAIAFEAQVPIAMQYRGECVGEFFADFIVDDKVIIELKAVERLHPAHTAQVLSYLRATKLRLGLLMNFNAATLVQGVRRIVL